MLFNSLHFLIFFPIVTAVYFSLKKISHRQLWLLAAGWYFYASWKPEFLILLIASTLTDFVAGKKISQTNKKSFRVFWLICSLIINLGILIGFKYFNFISSNLYYLFGLDFSFNNLLSIEKILLPVGISFYTFQTMSYTIDVFRGKQKAEFNFIKFALFVSFFPQLVAGPIERASNLLPQFEKKARLNYDRISSGLKFMVWGFFQKIVIADNMSPLVDAVYANPEYYKGFDVMLATFFFSVQIYCDFSGYTDIARGAARILGFELQVNFLRPYFSKSIKEFWQRWHISLNTWFRDYVYISLGGNRVKYRVFWIANILITFTLSGMWHGAGWTFIIWGSLHGIFYLIENFWKKRISAPLSLHVPSFFKILIVFAFVNFSWLFFRAEQISDSFIMLKNSLLISETSFNFDHKFLLRNFILIAILLGIHLIERRQNIVEYVNSKPLWVRNIIYRAALLFILFFGNFGIKEFIYFRF